MSKDFKDFMQYYLDNSNDKIVETKTGTIPFDFSSQDDILKSIESLEKEMLNVNLNMLYSYHNWLNSEK